MGANIARASCTHDSFKIIRRGATSYCLECKQKATKGGDLPFSLNEKEIAIAILFSQGLVSKEIGVHLGMAEGAVHIYSYRAREKTNTKTIAEFVSFLIRNKIIE